MPTSVFGYPASLGDVAPEPHGAVFVKVRRDGTRRVAVRSFNGANVTVRYRLRAGAIITDEFVGDIPFRTVQSNPFRPASQAHIDAGRWIGYADEAGYGHWSGEPVTPGTDFYRFRGILAEHAHRFLTEHNPANLRLADPLYDRIEHIAHELTNEDRSRAGNVSSWTRELIGYLWWRIEQFRVLPFGTVEQDAAWRAQRDVLEGLFQAFCALCEGSGMSHRTMRLHPTDDWERWAEAQVRFSVDRDFTAVPVAGASQITPGVAFGNRINFRNALDHFGEGHPDDDYLAPRTTVRDQTAAPVMPTFDGDHAMERAELASYWRIQNDAYRTANSGHAVFDTITGIYRNWIVFNLLYALDDRNLNTRFPSAALQANKVASAGSTLITTLAGRFSASVFNAWAGTFPATLGGFLVYDAINNDFIVAGGFVTDTGAAAQAGSLEAWDETIREQRFDIVDAILGDRTPGRPAPA